MNEGIHSVAWLAWAVAAALSVQLAPSPVYVALIIAVAAVVVEAHGTGTGLARAFPALIAVGAGFAVLRVVLTAVTTHTGAAAMFTLPEATLPRILGGFTVGGAIERGVVLQAAVEGFAIVGIMAAFGAFNAVASHHELLQSAPRAFYEPGLVVTVALAFVPSTMAAIRSVREADEARTGGRVVRRGRLLRQAVPLLGTGLERAVNLAESMDARGFGRHGGGSAERASAWLGGAALLSLGAAFVALVARAEPAAMTLGAVGAATLAAAIVTASRAVKRVRYRPRSMTGRDWAVVAGAAAVPLVLGALGAGGDDTLRWTDPGHRLPGFHPLPAVAVLMLGAPALIRGVR